MVGTPSNAHSRVRQLCPPYGLSCRVGKGALAPCPPSYNPTREWWAHHRTRIRASDSFAHPTDCHVGWAKALLRRAHHRIIRRVNGGHTIERAFARPTALPTLRTVM